MDDDLFAEFYRAHPEHILGIVTQATVVETGEPYSGHAMDSESLRAFFTWLVRTGRKPRFAVERAWMAYHAAAPASFPLPFPWEDDPKL